jgi:hypothetical protein
LRKQAERGAALFVVVLVLTLLTAVGLFAAQSATLVDQASGYSRQAAQTAYLAEYGVVASAAELGSGAAGAYRQRMLNPTDGCRMNLGISEAGVGAPPCLVFHLSDFVAPSGEPMLDTSLMSLTPDLVVEVTDPGPTGAPVAGTDVSGLSNSFGYMKVTATTVAQIRPAGAAQCVESTAIVAAQQMMRAHLVVGPVAQ